MKIGPAAALTATVVVLIAGAVGLLRLGCHKDDGPVIEGPVRVVPDTVILRSRPQVVTRWRDRIIVKTVPAQVTVSQGVPDTAFALRYARRALAADSVRRAKVLGDSLARQPGPVLPPASGTFDGKRLDLWLTRSDGSLMHATAKVRPRFWFYAGTDAGSDTLPIFRSDRWFVRAARQAVKCAPPVAVVAGVGALVNPKDRVLGAIIGGGATLLGCLSG